MDNELISIIIPIYKVEKYIETCVQSVLSQSYKNIEVILVDDGSPDSCPEFCDFIAKQHKNVKVIHKNNGGLSDARNAGIEQASGEYIFLLDSDDYILDNTIKLMYETIKEKHADIIVSGYACFEDETNNLLYKKQLPKTIVLQGNEKHYYLCAGKESMLLIVPWNKLYKKKVFQKIHFPVGKVHEDEFVVHEICDIASKIVIIPDALYMYRKRIGSIMESEPLTNKLCAVEAFSNRILFYCEKRFYELVGICMILTANYIVKNFSLKSNQNINLALESMITRLKKIWNSNKKEVKNIKRRVLMDIFFENRKLYSWLYRKFFN